MPRALALFVFAVSVVFSPFVYADDIEVGSNITFVQRLRPDGSDKGIPGHPSVGSRALSKRFPSGSSGTVTELGTGDHLNWIEVDLAGEKHWFVTKYVASVVAPADGSTGGTVRIGCWNLEWFHSTRNRGFPEYQYGGPTYQTRTDEQIEEIAEVITDRVGMSLVVLSEINGVTSQGDDGESDVESPELNKLLGELPDGWDYTMGYSGRGQRLAFLFDGNKCRMNEVIEYDVPRREIQDEDIFARDPLAAHVSFLQNGAVKNDLVVFGLHLASGQQNHRNHDAAMKKVRELLAESLAAGELGGQNEHDIMFMGDLNANMFRPPVEQFFIEMDETDGKWDVLAADNYPATRLSGVPLGLDRSQIDYIIASRRSLTRNGLVGDEINGNVTATVHTELLQWKSADKFREDISDHLPVTIDLTVRSDDD